MPTCCVCGKDLPNKYSVAARCSEPGCEAVFCTLHAATWNKRCPAHGGSETSPLHEEREDPPPPVPERAASAKESEDMDASEEKLVQEAKRAIPASRLRGIVASVGEFAARAGKLAGDLVRRIRNEKDPQQVLASIDASLEANRAKSKPLQERNAALMREIAAKKKSYEAAPAARRKVLELELRNLLAEYKAVERQLSAHLENEHSLLVVRGRLLEQVALGMQSLKEEDVDKLADDIDEAVAEAENLTGAVRELDRAGKRHERESDADDFAAELAGFDDVPDDPAAFEADTPAAAPADAAAPLSEPAAPATEAEPPVAEP